MSRPKIQSTVIAQKQVVKTISHCSLRYGPWPPSSIEMPLANVAGPVPMLFEDLGKGRSVVSKHLDIIPERAIVKRMLTAHEHCSHGRTYRRVGDAMFKSDTFLAQSVYVRSYDLLITIAAQHIVRLLIGKYKQQVRLWFSRRVHYAASAQTCCSYCSSSRQKLSSTYIFHDTFFPKTPYFDIS